MIETKILIGLIIILLSVLSAMGLASDMGF